MKLIDKLPYFYEECPKTNTIQEGLGSETENLYHKVRETTKQLYIDSTTWALGEWEKFAGIKKVSGTIEQRRSKVAAKLKAKGTTTLEVLTSVCETYFDKVEIEELFSEYALIISFISDRDDISIPQYNLQDIDEAIWEIKPAHLNHYFSFTQSRKLGIMAKYEDIFIKYIPCNACYAGELQPNTYNREKELYNLESSYPDYIVEV